MLVQILVGAAVSALNIIIHALLTVSTIWAARSVASHDTVHPWSRLVAIMIATVLVLMAAHTAEVFVWSAAYALTNAAPEGSDLFYFAFVNYATLGYGDITPVARWRLLGPMTAMNGVLLSGWSTAVIFEVLRRALSQHTSSASSYG
jgi:Ion channel